MKNLLLFFAVCVFGTAAMASDHSATAPNTRTTTTGELPQGANARILGVATFNVTEGVSVQLPKWKLADGTICQRYVASATESKALANSAEPMDRVQVTFGEVCGKAKLVDAGFFGHGAKDEVPENLKAMRTETAGGLSFQRPDLQVAK